MEFRLSNVAKRKASRADRSLENKSYKYNAHFVFEKTKGLRMVKLGYTVPRDFSYHRQNESMSKKKKSKYTNQFVQFCLELLAPSGHVTARAMFGGHGLYRDRAIFGLIADDRLYFKTDDTTRHLYEQYHAEPFTYSKQGKKYQMSYYEVPVEVMENPGELSRFVDAACSANRHIPPD